MTTEIESLEQRTKTTPEGVELACLLNSLALSYSLEERHEEAAETFARYITLRDTYIPNQPPKRKSIDSFQHGLYLEAAGKQDQAVEQYVRAVEEDIGSAGSYNRVKSIMERQGKNFQQFLDSMQPGKARNAFKVLHWLTTDADVRSVREMLDKLNRE